MVVDGRSGRAGRRRDRRPERDWVGAGFSLGLCISMCLGGGAYCHGVQEAGRHPALYHIRGRMREERGTTVLQQQLFIDHLQSLERVLKLGYPSSATSPYPDNACK